MNPINPDGLKTELQLNKVTRLQKQKRGWNTGLYY